jgi:HTH-type transcriptional regulator, sugar sensing transcriptional regulator
MLHDPRTISTLQKLGLTYYGAKAYAALMKTGVTIPTVLSEESGVPRTKIYEVLRKLEEDGWVTVEKGRPSSITPRYPKEIIEERKAIFNLDIDRISNEMAMTYDRLVENANPKASIINCIDTIIHLTEEMMNNARKRIMIMGTLYSPEEMEPIKKSITKAQERGVSVRIITMPSLKLKDSEINIITELSEATKDIKVGHPAYIKTLMADDREILITIARVEGNIPDMENVSAIQISNPSFASYMSSVFDMDWKNFDFYNEKLIENGIAE